MKRNLNRKLIAISLFALLILSLGIASASNADYSNDYSIDASIDNSIENSIKNNEVSQENSLNEVQDASNRPDEILDDDLDSKSENKLKSESNSLSFKDIQNLVDKAKENDTIQLNGEYIGNSNPIIINKTLTLKGTDSTVLDGQYLSEILEINAAGVVIDNIKFIKSKGLGVDAKNNGITIKNCNFEECIDGELGSALSCTGHNISIINSNFTNNIANKSSCHHTDGAAIHMIGNNALIDNCNFINNSGYNYETASSGGAIFLKGNNCTISNSNFINNSATAKWGWDLHNIEESYLADGYGGAIYWCGNDGRIANSSFVNGITHTDGGALYFKGSKNCSITNCSFKNNFGISSGGAIYFSQETRDFVIEGCEFINNTLSGLDSLIMPYTPLGSDIYGYTNVYNILIKDSVFINTNGSSIYYTGSNLTIDNSILINQMLNNSIVYKNGSLSNIYWGIDFNSSEEIVEKELINLNGEYVSPENWINLKIDGPDSLDEKGNYEYNLYYVLNDGSIYNSLPKLNLKLENKADNTIPSNLTLIDNIIFNYTFNQAFNDTVSILDECSNVILTKNIVCGYVYPNNTGNDTKDLQDAINSAKDGFIILIDRDYSIGTINIDKNLTITGNGIGSIQSENDNVLFNIASKSENPDLDYVIISNLCFYLKNGDIIVQAYGIDSENQDYLNISSITITNNNINKTDEGVIGESITVLEILANRPNPLSSDIELTNNTIDEGIKTISFTINNESSSDVIINKTNITDNQNNDTNSSNSSDDNSTKPVVSKLSTKITVSNMATTTVYSKDGKIGKYLKIKLTDSLGNALSNKKIKIGFNSKLYTLKTDKNGYAKLQINIAKKGTYTASICFIGDDKYNGSIVVRKISVKAQKAKLTVSKKTYKLKSKKKYLIASFKTAKGKAIAGKKLSFRINGKTYTAKTNSKGIAKVKVKLSKKKTYSFTVKFAGDNTFAKLSKKSKVVVK